MLSVLGLLAVVDVDGDGFTLCLLFFNIQYFSYIVPKIFVPAALLASAVNSACPSSSSADVTRPIAAGPSSSPVDVTRPVAAGLVGISRIWLTLVPVAVARSSSLICPPKLAPQ